MAAGPALLDVNTGQPVNNSVYPRPTAVDTRGVTSGAQAGTTATTTQTQATSLNVQQQNILNTTPQALQALHSLIAQLSDRPAISEEELNARVPLITAVVPRSGPIYWQDPLTGTTYSQADAQRINAERTAERARIQQAGGVIRGGTQQQLETADARATEIDRSRTQQGDYTKSAAMADAQALIDKAIADALRTAMPQIVSASEGAGTSKSTFRAQATQEAATRGGIEGAALGANLSVQYGAIFNQLEQTLELLTRQDPNGPAALLIQALNAAKGIAQTGGTVTSGVTNQTQTVQGEQNQVTTGAQVQAVDTQYQQASQPGLPLAPAPAATPRPQTNPSYTFAPGTPQPNTTFDANAEYNALIDMGV